MSAPAHPRPPQVTVAGWMIIVGSLLVVGSVFEMMGGLRSLETTEAIDSFLSEPPGDTLGWGRESVLEALRIASMVTAGCATAAAVLGWHVLRRHRGARVGLTVLAFPLFVAGVVTGGFMSSLVAAASLMLWLQPARDWFNGKEWRPPASVARDRAEDEPRPNPFAAPQPGAQQSLPQQPVAEQPAPPYAGPAVRAKRPDMVVVAALITWVFAGLTFLVTSLSVLVVASSPGLVTEEIERQQPELLDQGVSESMLVTTTVVFGTLTALLALAAIVAAALVVRRVRWAGTLLLVLSVGSAVVCFLLALSSVVLALPAWGAVVVAFLLRRRDVRAWLAAR